MIDGIVFILLFLMCKVRIGMLDDRLGDFPHALYFKDSLSEVEFAPIENLWVLEIHIRCQESKRGAFYEDILSRGL